MTTPPEVPPRPARISARYRVVRVRRIVAAGTAATLLALGAAVTGLGARPSASTAADVTTVSTPTGQTGSGSSGTTSSRSSGDTSSGTTSSGTTSSDTTSSHSSGLASGQTGQS